MLTAKQILKISKIIDSKQPGELTIKKVRIRIDPIQQQLAALTPGHASDKSIPITDEKTGGLLPLVALVPLIAKVLAGVGLATSGIATAAKVGHDISRGRGYHSDDDDHDHDNHDHNQCSCHNVDKSKIIQAIRILHDAGFSISRL